MPLWGMLLVFCSTAATVSDSLPLEGYYTQDGRNISRRKLERFLRDQDTVSDLAARSRGYRLAAAGIGGTMTGINLGISIYQFTYLLRAIERQEPITIPLENLATPLLIGGQVTGLIQGRFNNRADYLLHKSALAFNQRLFNQHYPDSVFSLIIEKDRFGWYRQDRLLMPNSVVYAVLREKECSRPLSNWSLVFREVAQPVQAFGALFLAYAIMGFITPEGVDPKVRNAQLSTGISLTGFGIINSVISWAFLKNAIGNYNDEVSPHKEVPGIHEDPPVD